MKVVPAILVVSFAIAGVAVAPLQSAQEPVRISAPAVVKSVAAVYTPQAMEARIQGSVLLDVVVLADGTVGEVTVARSLDPKYGLDEEAVKAVKQWLFTPGTLDGKPVPVRVQIDVRFALR